MNVMTFVGILAATFFGLWSVGLLILAVLSEDIKQRYIFYVIAFIIMYCAFIGIRATY